LIFFLFAWCTCLFGLQKVGLDFRQVYWTMEEDDEEVSLTCGQRCESSNPGSSVYQSVQNSLNQGSQQTLYQSVRNTLYEDTMSTNSMRSAVSLDNLDPAYVDDSSTVNNDTNETIIDITSIIFLSFHSSFVTGGLHFNLSRYRNWRFQWSTWWYGWSFSYFIRSHRVVIARQELLVKTNKSYLLYARVYNQSLRSQAIATRCMIIYLIFIICVHTRARTHARTTHTHTHTFFVKYIRL